MTLDCMTFSLFYLLFSRADYDRHKLRAYNNDYARPVGLPSDPQWPRRHVIPWNLIGLAVVTGLNELYLA